MLRRDIILDGHARRALCECSARHSERKDKGKGGVQKNLELATAYPAFPAD